MAIIDPNGIRTPVLIAMSSKIQESFIREDSERESRHGSAWMALDVTGIVIGWPAFGDIRGRSIGELVSATKMGIPAVGRDQVVALAAFSTASLRRIRRSFDMKAIVTDVRDTPRNGHRGTTEANPEGGLQSGAHAFGYHQPTLEIHSSGRCSEVLVSPHQP
jgi:hypothetical protein